MSILEINNLRKVYDNGKEALKGVTLSINKGEFVALLGPNGAGKSTLINILSDVIIKSAGSANVCGYDLTNEKINFKRSIGIVPQDINFDPFFNPFEVLMMQQGFYGLKPNKDDVLTLLKNMGLKDQAYTYARNLSGGMKRRLLIAKALIHDPEVIILDEPTAGVDVELRQHLWQYLKLLNSQGKTIILTTHYLEEAEALCDKIAIINHGELITFDTKQSLIDKIGTKFLELTLNQIPKDLSLLDSWEYKILDSNCLEICYQANEDIGKILELIVKSNSTIVNLKIKESSLEDVFLKLTVAK